MNTIQLAKYIYHMVQNGNYTAGHTIFNRIDTMNNTLLNKILKEGLIIQDTSISLSFDCCI